MEFTSMHKRLQVSLHKCKSCQDLQDLKSKLFVQFGHSRLFLLSLSFSALPLSDVDLRAEWAL